MRIKLDENIPVSLATDSETDQEIR